MELDNNDTTHQADSMAITATGNSPNNHEGEHQENNGNNDDMEDSGGESNDKDGGRGGGRTGTTSRRGIAPGRGRDRYQLGSQDDVGGRGGQHISEKGSDTIAAHNNITTIVIQKNDTIAQTKGNNGQQPNANGKPDNVSTSPQKTGADENDAG